MKKANAHDLHDSLVDEFNDGNHEWLPRLCHSQQTCAVNYYIRLERDLPDTGQIPMLPRIVQDLATEYDIPESDRHRFTRNVNPENEEGTYKESRYETSDTRNPHFELILDNKNSEMLSQSPEEERQERLKDDIRDALSLPGVPKVVDKLATQYTSVAEILAAPDDELSDIERLGPKTLEAIREHRSPELTERLKQEDTDRVVVVAQNEHGTFVPVYEPDSNQTINASLLSEL